MKVVTSLLAAAAAAVLSSTASATYVAPGAFQGWNPPTAPVLANVGGNIYEATLTGLTNGTVYEFKILNSPGSPAWGDPEVTPNNAWLVGDSDGSVIIRLDLGPVGDGNSPNTNRVGIVGDNAWTPQIVGDFMNEAGGAGDWNPNDPMFDMTNNGGGAFSYDAVISTPGTYQYKTTDGNGWSYQLGADGLSINAATLNFTTTDPNQHVIFSANTGQAAINAAVQPIPEPMSAGLIALGGLTVLRRRK